MPPANVSRINKARIIVKFTSGGKFFLSDLLGDILGGDGIWGLRRDMWALGIWVPCFLRVQRVRVAGPSKIILFLQGTRAKNERT